MSRYSTEPHTPLARLVVAACVSPSRAARYATDRWLPKALRAVTILGLAALIGLTACQKRQEPGVADGGGTEPRLSVLVKGSTQSIGRAELLKRRDVEAIENRG